MKILIVEDNDKHLQDAVEVFSKYSVEVITATNADQAITKMCAGGDPNRVGSGATPLVDGVITDIYIPLTDEEAHLNTAENPCGLNVAAVARNAGIPYVFCTAGFHHGTKFEWIYWLLDHTGWAQMVDSGQFSGDFTKLEEVDTKNWELAFEHLQSLMSKS